MGQEHTKNVGGRLRELRLRYKLSMRKLAKLAGVTVSYVSDVEAGRISPTLTTLRKLLIALDTDLGEFLADNGGKHQGYVFRGDRMRSVTDQDHTNLFILPRRLDIHLEVLHETIMPSDQMPEFETLSSDEAGYVIEGQLCIEIEGDEPQILGPGDGFYVPAGRPLRGYCATEEPVRFIGIYHPPRY
ncbi:MAG: helix-turn-helix domain-containing protein [Armatimonadota bacterium]